MLANPDITPSASINRWIISILLFHFKLIHVAGTSYAPDGLSQRPPQPDDIPETEDTDFDDWVDRLYGFVHQINPPPCTSETLQLPIATYSSEIHNPTLFNPPTVDNTILPDHLSTSHPNLELPYTDIPWS